MKYCSYCGGQVADEAVVCMHCGRLVDDRANIYGQKSESLNILCLLGFIFSFITGIVGLILSIIGYNQVKHTTDNTSKTLAKAGIIISSIQLGLIVLCIFLWIFIIGFFITGGIIYY